MKRTIKILMVPLLVLGFISMASAQPGSSPGATATANASPTVINPGATVALITTTTTTGVEALLTSQGIIYDLFPTSVFETVILTGYSSVIVAMDGGSPTAAGIQNLAAYANAGGNLIMLGGSNYQPFRDAVNANLLLIDTLAGWVLQPNPTWVAVDPAHYLNKNIVLPYNAVGTSTNYRMIVNLDPAAVVASNNALGENAIFNKPLGSGSLTWVINAPDDVYWADPTDRAALDAVIVNALNPVVAPPAVVPDYAIQFNTFTDCLNLWLEPDGSTHGNIPIYGPGTIASGQYSSPATVGLGFNNGAGEYMYVLNVPTRSVNVYSLDAIGSTRTLVNTDTWSIAASCTGVMNGGGKTSTAK